MVAYQFELAAMPAVPAVPDRIVLLQPLRDSGPQVYLSLVERRVAGPEPLAHRQPVSPRRHVQGIRSGRADKELPIAEAEAGEVGVFGGIVQVLHPCV